MQTPQLPNGSSNQFPYDKTPNPNETSVIPLNLTESAAASGQYYSYNKQKEEEGSINLRELWRRVKRRKWLVAVIVSVATLMTAVESARQKNIYQAVATIEVGKNNQMVLKTGDLVIENGNSQVETAVFLLTSYPLLEDAAANLNLDKDPAFLDITRQRSFWDVVKNKFNRNADGANAESERKEAEQLSDVTFQQRSLEESKRLAPYVNILRDGISVKQFRESKLVKLSFNHTNPEVAARVVNGIAKTFSERSYLRKTETFSNTSGWLSRSTRELEAQMQRAEQALADYTRNNGIFTTEGKEDLTTTKLANLYEQSMRAETDLLLKKNLYDEVSQGRTAQLPEAFSNLATTDLEKKLSELTVAAAQLKAKYGDENPRLVEIKDQRDALQEEISKTRAQLAEKLKADYERAVRDDVALKNALSRAKVEAVRQNQTAIQYNILRSNVETAKTIYTDFLQKTRQADVERAQQSRDVDIAEPARVPVGPIGPLRFRSVMLAFFLSLLAGVGLCFLLDHLDNTIKSVEDVNRYVHLPALGVIPAFDSNSPRRLTGQKKPVVNKADASLIQTSEALAKGDPASHVAEAYRMLRTSILLAAAGHPPKTILMTSSQPGEGKTTTSVNIGICLSQMGAKVLIIDADMRRPRVHKMFGLNHRRGLSNYLSSDVMLNNVIQATKIPNLWVLPSGIVPPNSADLLSSDKMRAMLQKLSGHFDHILIDSPPITSVTDPILLSRLVDGVVMIIHGGKSSRELVLHARQELYNVGAKIFGIVLNNVNLQRDGYDYYYRRYQYEYVRDANELT